MYDQIQEDLWPKTLTRTRNRFSSPSLSSLPEDSPHAKIMRLLCVLCQLNMIEDGRVDSMRHDEALRALSILEVGYFEKVGTCVGSTQEIYSLVSKEFARKDLKLWRDFGVSGHSAYVNHSKRLLSANENVCLTSFSVKHSSFHVVCR
jgi:hypothetical protein